MYFNTIVGKRGNEKERVREFSLYLSLWTSFCSWQFTQSDIFSSERVWMVVWFPLMRWSRLEKASCLSLCFFLIWVEIVTYQTNQAQDQSDLFLCFVPGKPICWSANYSAVAKHKTKSALLIVHRLVYSGEPLWANSFLMITERILALANTSFWYIVWLHISCFHSSSLSRPEEEW